MLAPLRNLSQIFFRARKMDVFLANSEPLVSVLDRLPAHFANLFGLFQFCSISLNQVVVHCVRASWCFVSAETP